MGAVHAVVKDTAIEVIKRAYKEGIRVQISSGYRSNAEQQKLFNQGRTTPGNIVTNARPGQSMHNYGLAVDYFLVSKNGKTALWDVNKNWRRVATIAKSLGFEWGGDWSGFKDYPHLQMTGGLSLSQLQAGKKPNLKSKVGGSKPAPSKPSKAKIAEDGLWGKATTRALQQALGTPVDGIISAQSRNAVTQALISTVRYGNGGSQMVRALQRKVGSKVDGYLGPATIRALQKHLGTPVDGKISNPSLMVTRLQQRLNAGTF
ncbi:M15 family metallopeptidase [Gracilibacillus alcaliphilus]|uniref:M15 family metallopeptidase n=1 Tax=Gracilibacillus alcaliphilus TaxID=1401441 RepID=UPI0023BACEF9|nr:M15 family metallopeptidase [Gracilibacillus alcaliphilus]MBM7678367.1 peptidoglycan L-alanyl-D-glutamate endopeptidase CwlK [Gracilibacillus alcaliphilus]